jgi:Domain of unknown function (DUF1707)
MVGPGDELAPRAGGHGHLRASDSDRAHVIDTLKAAYVYGLVTKEEFDARVSQAFASRTHAELALVTADLPAGLVAAQQPPSPAPGARRMHFGLSRAPRPVRTAARLMCLGAVLTLVDAFTVLVTLGGVRSAAVQDVDFTGGRWHIFMLTVILPALASAPIVAGMWLWLAWAIGRGHAWARPAFMVFFGLLTTGWLIVLAMGSGRDATAYTWPDLLATTVLWLVGLVAMVLIFSETASPYYQQEPAQQWPCTGRAADTRRPVPPA